MENRATRLVARIAQPSLTQELQAPHGLCCRAKSTVYERQRLLPGVVKGEDFIVDMRGI